METQLHLNKGQALPVEPGEISLNPSKIRDAFREQQKFLRVFRLIDYFSFHNS